MLAKLTSQNRITLPQAVVSAVASSANTAQYFEVAVEAGRIVLTPVHDQQAQTVRAKMRTLGVCEADVDAAVAWARQ